MKPPSHIVVGSAVAVMSTVPLAEGEPAEWVQLLPFGKFGGRDGRGPYELVDAAHAAQVIAASRSYAGSADAPVDYDHQTDYAATRGVGGRAPASGWIKDYEVRDSGIWGRVEWTAGAHAQLKAGEYRYISPVFTHQKAGGRVGAILRAGLTNSPNLDLVAVASADPKEPPMSLTAIAAALGLGEAASEQECLDAITSLRSQADGLATAAQAAGAPKGASVDGMVTAISAAISTAQPDPAKFVPADQVVAIQTQLTALTAERATEKAEAAVDAAIEAGQIVPALRDHFIAVHKSDPAQFAEYASKAPVIVAPGALQLPKTPASGEVALTAEELAVCSAMGLTEAEMLETKKGGL